MEDDGGLTIRRTECGPVKLVSGGNALDPGKPDFRLAWTSGQMAPIRNRELPLSWGSLVNLTGQTGNSHYPRQRL